MSEQDKIYQTPQSKVTPFSFDEKVAAVFPDMIQRSVPGYNAIIECIQQLSANYMQDNTQAYDLGCSLGAASLAISLGNKRKNCRIIAVDNSPAMLDRCQLFLQAYRHSTPIDLVLGDIQNHPIDNASMAVLNFTLQFIPLEQRADITRSIYNGLNPGGLLILSEKIKSPNDEANQMLIDLHHQFKRSQGYSDLEISQKRNALENVLIPETLDTHFDRLKNAGFKHCELLIRHYNFCSLVAIKD